MCAYLYIFVVLNIILMQFFSCPIHRHNDTSVKQAKRWMRRAAKRSMELLLNNAVLIDTLDLTVVLIPTAVN